MIRAFLNTSESAIFVPFILVNTETMEYITPRPIIGDVERYIDEVELKEIVVLFQEV